MISKVEERLEALGVVLPEVPVPVAAYVPAKRVEDIVYSSGQTAWEGGILRYPGRVGGTVTLDEAVQSARISAINCISALRAVVDLDRIKILKVTGFVNAEPDFGDHPAMINGASELIIAAFGERGRHARCAIGAGSLPSCASVEIEILAAVAD